MGQLIGFFIRIITFPGLILDYYINKKTANFLSIVILKDDFSKILSGDAIEIDSSSKYYKLWLFSFLPFLIQTLIALIVCYFAAWAISISDVTVKGKIFFLIFSYLGIAIAAHAFPDTKVGKLLWKRSIQELKSFNLFGFFAFPYVILIYVIRILHFLWIDILYGIAMIFVLKDLFFDK